MNNNSFSDNELVIALNNSDRAAFKFIYQTYYSDLCKYICSYTNSTEAAEDIIQNVLLKVWEKREQLKIHTSFKNYLFRSAYNTFIDTYRKTKRINEKLEAIRHNALNEIVEENHGLQEQRIKALKKAIEELPPKCKKIFLLSKIEGYKYKEIAEILGISVNTVENQIGKAFKVIRKKILSTKPLNFFLSFFERNLVS